MPGICQVIEEAKLTAREQRAAKPQPWIVLKLMVFIATGIMGYAAYVYISKLCVEMIRRKRAGASKGTGIALLVVFCLLFLWMLWAYAMVVLIPPGFARDHVPQCPPPIPPPPVRPSVTHPPANGNWTHEEEDNDNVHSRPHEQTFQANDAHLDTVNAISQPPNARPEIAVIARSSAKYVGDENRTRAYHDLQRAASRRVTRRPPTTPVLAPEYRYCSRCLLLKPYRAHHCRACGTCVLKYDHHCPWIGQCVGARNHKFFINFNLVTTIFTSYTVATLVVYTVHSSNNNEDPDPQQILVTALSGLFLIFSAALLLSHTRFLALSLTTVESLQQQSIKDRENHMLADVFGFWELRSKRRVKTEWDQEWGRIDREGNMWWVGSKLKAWEETMGTAKRTVENPWGWLSWILPLTLNRKNDAEMGMNYEVNPRFDKEGRWRRRSEWPEELR